MCTVSFIPKSRGFYLAMNRDEKLTRFTALPPTIVGFGDRRAILPREPSGGTWIAANDAGICFTLINWHRIAREPARAVVSRGQVVAALAGVCSAKQISRCLASLPLGKLRPFRLIVAVPSVRKLIEWQWDLRHLRMQSHRWRRHHWFSSGLDEAVAEARRAKTCAAARRQISSGSIDWLRRLHRSHQPTRGAFSICMHRADAATVSYTEVIANNGTVTMRYKPGPPCVRAPFWEIELTKGRTTLAS